MKGTRRVGFTWFAMLPPNGRLTGIRWLMVSVGIVLTASLYGQSCKSILALVRGRFLDMPALIAMYNQYTVSDGSANGAGDIGVSFPGRSALEWVN